MSRRRERLMLVAWLREKALPLWGSRGFDADRQRFFERLDWRGRPMPDVPHRAMVQARQIAVFAQAARSGWYPAGGALAEAAMASFLRDFQTRGADGGIAFSIRRDGTVESDTRDAYAHAFTLFALASLYRLNGDATLLSTADALVAFIEACLIDHRHGGLFDAVPVSDQTKRQNPHMHLLEAYLALEEAAPDRGYLGRAEKIVELFERRFFSHRDGALLEYFAPDWGPHADPLKAQIFEPGHHYEWIWLLDRYAAASGTAISPAAARLHETAAKCGLNARGLLFDEVRTDGVPGKRSSRVWPHTEAIKAAAVQGDEGTAVITQMTRALFEHFLDQPVAGTWIDHIDEAGAPLSTFIPASSLYHLFVAGSEIDRTQALPPGRG